MLTNWRFWAWIAIWGVIGIVLDIPQKPFYEQIVFFCAASALYVFVIYRDNDEQ